MDNRQDSITQEFVDDADIAIYTDGSRINEGSVGASAVMLKKGHQYPPSKLRYHLGYKSQHSSYEAEVVGLLLGAHLLYRERNVIQGKIVMYSDNQGTVQAPKKPRAKSSQHILKKSSREWSKYQKHKKRGSGSAKAQSNFGT